MHCIYYRGYESALLRCILFLTVFKMLCESDRLSLLVLGLCLGELLLGLDEGEGPVYDLVMGRPDSLSWSGIDWFRCIPPSITAAKKVENRIDLTERLPSPSSLSIIHSLTHTHTHTYTHNYHCGSVLGAFFHHWC